MIAGNASLPALALVDFRVAARACGRAAETPSGVQPLKTSAFAASLIASPRYIAHIAGRGISGGQ